MNRILTTLLLFLAIAGCTKKDAEVEPLRVSAIPDESPTELMRKFEPLGKYLESKIGRPVKFTPVTDYAATVEGLAAKKLDMVWYGGFTFVQARRRTGTAIPLVQREEDAQFHSRILVPAASTAQKLEDLKGGTFAFGSPSSTSGHLMPRFFLLQAGIDPDKDFKAISFTGAHDATVKTIEAGKVDGGAVNESVWLKMVAEKKVDPSKVRELWTTPAYHDYNWTVRGDLDPQLMEKLKAAFLALDVNKPEDKAILDLQRTKKFIETKVENYDAIGTAAKAAGLIKD